MQMELAAVTAVLSLAQPILRCLALHCSQCMTKQFQLIVNCKLAILLLAVHGLQRARLAKTARHALHAMRRTFAAVGDYYAIRNDAADLSMAREQAGHVSGSWLYPNRRNCHEAGLPNDSTDVRVKVCVCLSIRVLRVRVQATAAYHMCACAVCSTPYFDGSELVSHKQTRYMQQIGHCSPSWLSRGACACVRPMRRAARA